MSLWRRVFVERRRLIVPLVTVLAINVAVLVLAVFPLQASVSGSENRANDVKLALANAQRAERVATETRASKVRADEELKKFYADVLPSGHAAARNLLYLRLRELSEATDVEFASSDFEPEPVDGSSLMRFRVDTMLTGDYANIRSFLYDLETSESFFIIEGVKLAQSNLDPSAGGSLQIVLQVATYYTGARQ